MIDAWRDLLVYWFVETVSTTKKYVKLRVIIDFKSTLKGICTSLRRCQDVENVFFSHV